jgi:hypothetical protein
MHELLTDQFHFTIFLFKGGRKGAVEIGERKYGKKKLVPEQGHFVS